MRLARVGFFALLLLVARGTALADTVRVATDRALVWTSPGGVSIVAAQLARDTVADVVRHVGDWFEIVIPAGGSAVPSRTGFVSASQVVVQSVGPRPANAARLAAGPRRPPPKRPTTVVNIDAALRWSGSELSRTSAPFAGTLAEGGRLEANYGGSSGWELGVLVGRSVAGPLGIGLAGGFYRRTQAVQLTAEIPHPFFFNRPRPAAFETAPLAGSEVALHVPVLWMPPTRGRLKVVAFGGPSVFRISQTVVTNVNLSDAYPHDAVAIASPVTEARHRTRVGFHAGGDVSYFFTRRVGIGAGGRYARATITFAADQATTDGTAGGVQAAAGLRLRF